MIETAVQIVDRLIQLLHIRKEDRSSYFDAVVEPLYRDVEVVATDYISLFRQLIAKLETEDGVPEIIKWLELRRLDLLPLRIKLRAGLSQLPRMRDGADDDDVLIKGTWGVLRGGLSMVEEGHAHLHEYGMGDHTVLDLLYHWSQQPLSANRDRYLRNTRRQLKCVETAWADVSEGYYAYRNHCKLNAKARKKR